MKRGFLPTLLVLAIAAPGIAAAGPCQPPVALAERILEGGAGWGSLAVSASYSLDEDVLMDEGRLEATVEAALTGPALQALQGLGTTELCFALVLDVDGELVARHDRSVRLERLAGARGLRYGIRAELPEATAQLMVIVQDPGAGLWGAVIVDDAGEILPPPGPTAVRTVDRGGVTSWYEVIRPEAAGPSSPVQPVVVRLIPPRREPVSGATRFDALVSTDAVERIVFRLDGEEVASRRRGSLAGRPFAARVELADPPRPQTLEVIAFGRDGGELGRDVLEINRLDSPFRVRFTEIEGDPAAGSVIVAAEVTVPAEAELDRLELYRNQTLVAQYRDPQGGGSFRTAVETPSAGPEDYLRVAAFLVDGSSIDDVVLLLDPGAVEEVEVNLVELHVVVTDAAGHPVADLGPGDFTIVHRGRPQPTQSFAYAVDVPLLLGLVVDTSGSMQLVMHDTRKAAAKFLGTTVLPQDRSFLVDFDRRPRLLHPTTDDLPDLLLDLARLEAEGSTAMYDAIVFSMVQFERARGRKALVILTDGDDYESRFGPKYCADLGRRAGVPIYIVGLGNLDILRRNYDKKALRHVTEQTGGRLYIVDSLADLDQAYAQINAELRSQYSLSFYTDRDLDDDERREVEVEIGRPGLEARTVVGGRVSSVP
ncbi:MAG: VWA domain-containing protein [Thermoanaerobaculia bacterium]